MCISVRLSESDGAGCEMLTDYTCLLHTIVDSVLTLGGLFVSLY